MSIAIDTNLIYLQTRLNLSAEQLEMYQGKSVTEVIEAEAAAGNTLAIELAEEIMTDVNLLIEIFKLADPNNKYIILMNMNSSQLEELIPLLEKEDLTQGLMFFTQDKLLKLLEEIPPEQLVNTVLEMFSQEEVIRLLPEEQLDKLLTSHELDKDKVLENLKSIPPEYLAQMIETITGEECKNKNNIDMVKQISRFNPLEYKEALTSMEPTQKQQLTLALTKENPELYQLFDASAYTNMINTYKQKPEIVKAMSVIETEEITKMIEQLPKDLLSLVITQIDTEDLADNLINKNPELIAELIAG